MMVRITGVAHAKVVTPMMVFQNAKSSYPIRGVNDETPGICYRSGLKGWMDKRFLRNGWRSRGPFMPYRTERNELCL